MNAERLLVDRLAPRFAPRLAIFRLVNRCYDLFPPCLAMELPEPFAK